ncbi:hypothetical protein BJ508DRAFT_311011 [Ascobolus immersus RN42]|uniref:Uncharacterized protein n=1 Tax=Ascobolus immersus RN42 TaxID=1160509 RepID=A0A3N4I3R8_ASCIM|nr:hypothetical protein BJ508DRAFT_311011 [Ascobolus immersus RN42]
MRQRFPITPSQLRLVDWFSRLLSNIRPTSQALLLDFFYSADITLTVPDHDWADGLTGFIQHRNLFELLWKVGNKDGCIFDSGVQLEERNFSSRRCQNYLLNIRWQLEMDLSIPTTGFAHSGYRGNPLRVRSDSAHFVVLLCMLRALHIGYFPPGLITMRDVKKLSGMLRTAEYFAVQILFSNVAFSRSKVSGPQCYADAVIVRKLVSDVCCTLYWLGLLMATVNATFEVPERDWRDWGELPIANGELSFLFGDDLDMAH